MKRFAPLMIVMLQVPASIIALFVAGVTNPFIAFTMAYGWAVVILPGLLVIGFIIAWRRRGAGYSWPMVILSCGLSLAVIYAHFAFIAGLSASV